MEQEIIKGSEIDLIQLRLEDVDSLFDLTDKNRSYLGEWLPWVRNTTTRDDSKRFVEYSLQGREIAGMHFGIWWHQDLAGVIGFHVVDAKNNSSSIGYWLGQNFQHKGIMTTACKMLVSYGFEKLGLHRIDIQCGVGNTKSSNIPKRLGFQLEGVSRESEWVNDHYVDLENYALLKPEWEVRKAE